jgi:hypothetical protein
MIGESFASAYMRDPSLPLGEAEKMGKGIAVSWRREWWSLDAKNSIRVDMRQLLELLLHPQTYMLKRPP